MSDIEDDAEVLGGDSQPASAPLSIRETLEAEFAKASAAEAPEKPETTRDEAGRFAAKAAEAAPVAEKPGAAPCVAAAPGAETLTAQPTPDAPKPPPGWSPEAKATFGTLPPEVQAAVSKREAEIDAGFKILQDYKGLEQFTPLVRQAGTTHVEVMRRAVEWEQALQRDPISVVREVARIGGVDLRALAAGQPQAAPATPITAAPPQAPQSVDAIVDQKLREREASNQVEAFLSDPANTHAKDVMEDMVALISAGRAKDLKAAYDMACWANPTVREALISQRAPAAPPVPKVNPADQARKASRSITGSSAPGASRAPGGNKPMSIREALEDAWASSGTSA